MSPFQAAIEGTREIGLAVMATTLSLLAVFVPVGFMGGIVGRFMSSFGLTAAFAIAVSLLVSFTLTPMLCSRLFKSVPRGAHAGGSKESRLFRPIDRAYAGMLRWSMAHRKVVVLVCLVVVLAIVPMFMVIGKNFVPEDDRSAFEVSIRAPEGTSLASSINIATQVARDIRTLPGVTDTLTNVGGSGEVNSTGIYVKLDDAENRQFSQVQLMDQTRELLKRYASTLRTSVQQAGGISAGARNAQVQYVLTGPDLDRLSQLLADYKVSLVEQPVARGQEAILAGWKPGVPVAADESIIDLIELRDRASLFDVVNIKLDKCGGLTEALAMAAEARAMGKQVMVGNMGGSTLAMAPGFILGQLCDYVDLDGPHGLVDDPFASSIYSDGEVFVPESVWGLNSN